MREKKAVALKDAYRLLNPGSVVLVSAAHEGETGLFPVTWNMPARKSPPLVAVLSGKRHHTYKLIEQSGELVLNVPTEAMVDEVLSCGLCSGRDIEDKFARFGLSPLAGEVVGAPLVGEAVAHLECAIEQLVDLDNSALILARVVAASADPLYFEKSAWTDKLGLVHHLGGKRFAISDRVVAAKMKHCPEKDS